MKRALLSLSFIFFFAFALCQTVLTGKVVAVADGDTFTLLTPEKKQVKIRLYGIDCPERKQDFGTKARQFTSDMVFSKSVSIKIMDVDRYGRTIGIVMLSDGRVLNRELLGAGLAWHYKYYDKSKEFADLEKNARCLKKGLWSMGNAVAPWEFRRK